MRDPAPDLSPEAPPRVWVYRAAERLGSGASDSTFAWVNDGGDLAKEHTEYVRADLLEALRAERDAAVEDASGASECLMMVQEVLVAYHGEAHMKGVPPMFYPEAIRSAVFNKASAAVAAYAAADPKSAPDCTAYNEMIGRHTAERDALRAENMALAVENSRIVVENHDLRAMLETRTGLT